MPTQLHPTTLIVAWIGFAVMLAGMSHRSLLLATAPIALLLLSVGVTRCWRLVRRTRMLLLAMLLVYLFATPGTPLISGWEQFYPTQQGLITGTIQAWRLLLLVSALAALMNFLTRQQLLAGIYVLLLPLKPLGVPVARFAVRLSLTLHYAETADKTQSLSARWESALNPSEINASNVQLEIPFFGLHDAAFVAIYMLLLGGVVCLG